VQRINVDDVIIIEGVVALLDDALMSIAEASIFVGVEEAVRNERLSKDYHLRGVEEACVQSILSQRLNDEVPLISARASDADYLIKSELSR
jgi:uridine kinase